MSNPNDNNNSNAFAEGHVSTKVIHKPGGASNFSLAHDNGTVDDRFGNSGKVGSHQ